MPKAKISIFIAFIFVIIFIIAIMFSSLLLVTKAANESAILSLINTNYSTNSFTITNNSTYPWSVSDSSIKELKSGNSNKSSTTSTLVISYSASVGDIISFSYKVSSEANYDKLTIKVGNTTVANVSGDEAYTDYSYTVTTAGVMELSFSYSKDGSVDKNSDAGFIKNISIMASTRSVTVLCDSLYGSVSGGGSYNVGDNIEITATAKGQYAFIGWKRNNETGYISNSSSYTVKITADVTYTAVFGGKIDFYASGGSVTTTGNIYELNSNITVSAYSNADTTFLYWVREDGYQIAENPLNFTVTKNETYTAIFTNNSLTGVNVSANYGGCVTILGDDFDSLSGDDIVKLKAVVTVQGYSFSHWQDKDGKILGYELSLNVKKSLVYGNIITAIFKQ